jgi:hypothetical protein
VNTEWRLDMSKNKDDKKPSIRNFVAKNAGKFCKAKTHRDRKNDYTRKEKHRQNYKDGGDASVINACNSLW